MKKYKYLLLLRGGTRKKNFVTKIKGDSKELKSFIVADTETVLINKTHIPYAAGWLLVKPGEDLSSKSDMSIHTFFSEDHLGRISST